MVFGARSLIIVFGDKAFNVVASMRAFFSRKNISFNSRNTLCRQILLFSFTVVLINFKVICSSCRDSFVMLAKPDAKVKFHLLLVCPDTSTNTAAVVAADFIFFQKQS